jgi:hypothetical protein
MYAPVPARKHGDWGSPNQSLEPTAENSDVNAGDAAVPFDEIEAGGVPQWVRGPFQPAEETMSLGPSSELRAPRPMQDPTAEIEESIHGALEATGFPVRRVRCRCEGETLVLTGETSCYFHAQIAVAVALRYADRRLIINRIQVVPPRERNEMGDHRPRGAPPGSPA